MHQNQQDKKIKAKKWLGQNFLKSKAILKKIVKSGEVTSNDLILEIGPGQGDLTAVLLKTGAVVVAVEKDREMVEILEEKFAAEIISNKLILIQDDILDFKIENSILKGKEYKLIANIPYYITGEIFSKFLSTKEQPSLIILLVQKEVATRIIARDHKESILSMSIKVYSKPQIITKVKAGSFTPAPKVDSAIIRLTNISRDKFTTISEKAFFKTLKGGFAHKRKRLFSNLKSVFKINENEIIIKTKLDKNVRAENLGIEDWINITKLIEAGDAK